VKELGVEGSVFMPGFLQNPYSWVRRAAAFVLSSRFEGLPTVLVEAMATGAQVIATDCPAGPAEILEGGRYSPLVPVGDVQRLAEAIAGVLSRPQAERGPCVEAMERARVFSVQSVMPQWEEYFLNL
jgi:glycosyltransferase involved in cell wall biosynthesis